MVRVHGEYVVASFWRVHRRFEDDERSDGGYKQKSRMYMCEQDASLNSKCISFVALFHRCNDPKASI